MSTIRLKRSAEPKKVPSFEQLELGEVAVNTYDGKMFLKREQNGELQIREFGARDAADNVFYVTTNGSNENDGKTIGDAFATIDHALKQIPEGSTLYVKAGQHTVDNPVKVPAFVAIVGDSLRTSFVQPLNSDKDIFWVNNGSFLKDMRFNNYIAPSAAVSFPPDGSAGSIMCSPYVQNCTSYTTTGTGMRVDGSVVTGLRSMVVDAYTQYNQGGIGVHHMNRGNTQLVSIFTISCDISILCETGGFCSLTNSNTSFGNYGLISDGYSEAIFSASAGANVSRNSMIFNDLVNIPYIQNAAVFADTDAVYTIKDATPIKVGQGVVTGPTLSAQDESARTARTTVLAAKESIQKATVEFVKTTFQTGAGFDEAKCARDSQLILEGAAFDNELGTNYNSVTNGLAYQRANSKFLISNQLDATLGAIRYLRDSVDSLFTAGNNDAYFDVINTIISTGATSTDQAAPTLTFPTTPNTSDNAEKNTAKLQEWKEFLAYDLEAWIAGRVLLNTTTTPDINSIWYNFTYDEAKCRRDVEYLIDAVSYDLTYGGNSAITQAIKSYFVGASLDQLPVSQVAATVESYNKLAEILQTLVGTNAAPNNDPSNPITPPSTDYTLYDDAALGLAIRNSIELVATTITAGTVAGLPATTYPNSSSLGVITQVTPNLSSTYDHTTGVLTVKTDSDHGLTTADAVSIAANSLTFTCAYDPSTPLTYPDAASPVNGAPTKVLSVANTTTFTINVGPATGAAANSAHTLTAVVANAIISANKTMIDTNIGNIIDGDLTLTGTFTDGAPGSTITDITYVVGLFQFINSQFNFSFDEDKCARDVDEILEAVSNDVALDSNFRSLTTGLSYTRANSAYLGSNQSEQTASAVEFVRDKLLTLLGNNVLILAAELSAVTSRFTDVINVLRNGSTASQVTGYPGNIVKTTPPIGGNSAFELAAATLVENRVFLQAEVHQFLYTNYIDVYNAMDKTKCARDTGFLIDAAAYDLHYGIGAKNPASYEAAKAYFVGAASQLGVGQKAATVAAYEYLSQVVEFVAGGDTSGTIDAVDFTPTLSGGNVSWPQSIVATVLSDLGLGSAPTVANTGGTTTGAWATVAGTLIDISKISIENDGNLSSVIEAPIDVSALQNNTSKTGVFNDTVTYTAGLKTDAVVYVEQNFRLLDFNQSKCYRDTGIIIEAAVDDMVLDTNYKSIVAGRLYSQNTAAAVISDQKPETVAAIQFARGRVQTALTDASISNSSAEYIAITNNIDTVLDHLENGKKVTETFTPYNVDYDPSVDNTMTLYIGKHNFTTSDSIVVVENSLTFTCPSGGGQISITHPRRITGDGGSDSGFRTPLAITAVTDLTITVDVGAVPSVPVNAQVPHTFVSALPNSIVDANAFVQFNDPRLVLPEVARAKESIINNRAYLIEEATAYIDQNYPLLGYNRETCERDIGLIIDAIVFDFMFGSNFRSITSGRSYLRGAIAGVTADRPLTTTTTGIKGQLVTSDPTSTSLNVGSSTTTSTTTETTSVAGGYGGSGTVTVTRDIVRSDTVLPAAQKAATVSAFVHLKDLLKQMVSQSSAVESIEDNMNLIINIVQDGAGVVPQTYTMPTPTAGTAGTKGVANIKQVVDNVNKNRKFLVAETLAFIDSEFPTVTSLDASGNVVRDYDTGGKCSRDLGYLLDAVEYDLTYGGNLETLIAGKSYFSDVVTAADGTVDKLGSKSVTVDIDDTRGDEGVFGVELNIADPAKTIRLTTKTAHGLRDGYTVTVFDVNGPIRLNAVDYFVKVIDSITFDIYEESTLTVPMDATGFTAYVNRGNVRINNAEVIATVESYKHLAKLIEIVAEGTALTPPLQSTVAQTTDATATDGSSVVRSGALIMDVITIIQNDSSNPAEELPELTWVDGYSSQVYPVGFANASLFGDYQVLTGEKDDLQASVTKYIESNFAYDKTTCKRDLGYILDAVLYDGIYRGNSQAVEAAKQYRSGGRLVVPELQKRATSDAIDHLGDRVGDVLRANRVAPTQDITGVGYVAQDTSIAATTITEILRIQQLFTDAASVVRRDYFINDFINVIDPDFASQTIDAQQIRDKILAEKQNLQVKTIKFIDSTFREFRFDKVTCARDVGLIVDAVAMDTVLGTNYNAIIAGLSYQRGSLSIGTVKDEQKPQTLAAIRFLKSETIAISGLSTVGIARATAAFDEILDIFENGTTSTRSAADDFVFDKTSAAGNADARKAHDLLIANREILGEEIIAWLDAQFTNFQYDADKCLRDTKLIVDALALDTVLNTNYNTVTVGLSYQRANASEVLTGQKIQTIAAVEHLKEEIDILTTLSTQGRARSKRLLDTLLDILSGAFSYDSTYDSTDDVGAVENIELNNPGNATQDMIDGKDQLRQNRAFLQADVVAYIENTYPALDYVVSRCKRDVGFIIDAINFDQLYGGNSATIQAARSYYVDGREQLGYDEIDPTIAGYEHLKTLIQPVVTVETVGNQPTFPKQDGNNLRQVVESDAGSAVEVQRYRDLIDIIIDVLRVGNVTGLPTEVKPSLTWADANLREDMLAFGKANARSTFTPFGAQYEPTTGVMTLDIGMHPFDSGDKITIDEGALAFSCGTVGDDNKTILYHPRSSDTTAFGNELSILAVTPTSVTVNVGISSETTAHTFISATEKSVTTTGQSGLGENVVAYVNEEFVNFTYDIDKCARDVKLITLGVANDIALQTNYNSTVSGISYLRANASKVQNAMQKAITIAAFTKLKEDIAALSDVAADATILAEANARIDTVISLFNNGGNAPALTFTSGVDANAIAARTALQTNRAALINGVISFIESRTDLVGSYNEAKCRRDSGLILDAVTRDMALGTNYNSVYAGISYIRGSNVELLTSNQRNATVQALTYLKAQTIKLANVAFKASDRSANTTVVTNLGNRFQEVIDIIADPTHVLSSGAGTLQPGVGNVPAITVDTTGIAVGVGLSTGTTNAADPDFANVAASLTLNKDFIVEYGRAFNAGDGTNGAMPAGYNETTCVRDLKYIVDGFINDMTYGGNIGTRLNAASYFQNAVLDQLPLAQKAKTSALYIAIAALIDEIVQNSDVSGLIAAEPSFNGAITVDTSTAAVTNVAARTAIGDLVDTIEEVITADSLTDASTKYVSVGELEPTITWADADTRSAVAEIKQEEKALLDSVIIFINKDLSYNKAKCERDTGILVDALSYDINYGGDSASKIAAKAYFVGAVSQLGTSTVEKTSTIAAFRHLGALLDAVAGVTGTELAATQSLLNNLVTWIVNGETYTPGAATTYDANTTGDNAGELVIDLGTPATTANFTTNGGSYEPTTGVMTLTTATAHNLAAGTFITIAKGGVTFECDSTQLTYPDADSPFLNRPIEILAVTSTEITVNVGIATNGYSNAHTWISGTFTAGAGFRLGDKVKLKDNSITFTCAYDPTTPLSYPNASSPVLGEAIPVLRLSGNTITVNVGIATGSAANQAHTFVSADTNSVTTVPSADRLFELGQASVSTASAARQSAHTQLLASRNTLASTVNAYTLATFPANTYDRTRCQRDVGFIVDALAYDVLYGGNSATREVARSYFSFALSQLGTGEAESKETRATLLAYDRLSDIVGEAVQGVGITLSTKTNAAANITPYFATYNLAGPLEVFIGTHTFVVGDKVRMAADSLSFTCASSGSGTPGPNGTIFKHPSNAASQGAADPALGVDLTITAVGELSFTVDVGAAPGGVGAHTFVGAADGAVSNANVVQTIATPATAIEASSIQSTLKIVIDVIKGGSVNKLEAQILPVITNASLSLQNDFSSIVSNKSVAQDATLQFIDDRYTTFSYDQFKCSRDVGLILDAVLADTVMGGNYQSLLAGSSYYRGSASTVYGDQLPETIKSIEFLQKEVEKILTDPLFTATARPGTYATPATRAITPVEAVENAKTSTKIYTGTPELAALTARFADVLRTMENGLVTTMVTNAPVTLVKGETVSQKFSRATGIVKEAVTDSTTVELISVSGTFNSVNTLSATRSGALGVEPISATLAALDTIDYEDPTGLTVDQTRAKNILEANKEFFVNEAVAFINETFPMLGYERETCERDVGLVLDAIGYDLMFGSNFRSVVAGRSYYRSGAAVVTSEQKKATLAAFQFIKTLAADAISAPLLSAAGFVAPTSKYTPEAVTQKFTVTAASYDATDNGDANDGDLQLTIGAHSLTVGEFININPNSLTFTCAYDNNNIQLSYPDVTSAGYKTTLQILAADATTITVNVGTATGLAANSVHTFVSAKANAVTVGGATYYDAVTGDLTLDLGTNATAAGFAVDGEILVANASLTFECAYDTNTPLAYPEKESTYYQKAIRIIEVKNDTITVNVGPAINAAAGSDHTFLTATADCIVKGEARTEFIVTVQEDSYTLAKTGSLHIDGVEKPVLQLLPGRVYEFNQDDISNVYYGDLRHPMIFGDIRDGNLMVGGNSYTTGVTFLLDGVSVALDDYIRDFANSTTRRVRLNLTNSYTTEIWYHSANNTRMGNQVYIEATGFENDSGAKKRLQQSMETIINILDTGPDTKLTLSSAVKFAKGEIITQEGTGVQGEVTSCDGTTVTLINVDSDVKYTTVTGSGVYETTYNHLDGELVLNIGAHSLTVGTKVLLQANSLTFTCAYDSGTPLTYPDATSPAFGTPVVISAVDQANGTITVNVGKATGAAAASVHTFVSSTADAVSVATFSTSTADVLTGTVAGTTAVYPTAVKAAPIVKLPTPTAGTTNAFDTDIKTTVANIESNRQFIVNEVTAYITELSRTDANFGMLGFNRELCTRDTGLVIDALSWDMLNGSEDGLYTSNARSITAARSYLRQTPNALPTNQTSATQAAFTYLGGLLKDLIISTSDEATKIKSQIDLNIAEINNQIGSGTPATRVLATPAAFSQTAAYTAGAATTYDANTGLLVLDLGATAHGMVAGDEVLLTETSVAFTCAYDGDNTILSYPDAASPAYRVYTPILSATTTTITVNVGKATNAAAGSVHTFVPGSSGTSNVTPRGLSSKNAVGNLTTNKAFIVDELNNWIIDQVATDTTNNTGTFNGFEYNATAQVNCKNDIGLIVDALEYDLTFGGNLETRVAALAYFSATQGEQIDTEQDQTLASYTRLIEIANQVITETSVTLSSSTTEAQNTSGEPGTVADQAIITDRIEEIRLIIEEDANINLFEIFPTAKGTTLAQATYNQFYSEKAELAPAVTAYVEDNFAYFEATCRRDVNYLLDAIRYDLTYGGTLESEIAARSYYSDEGVNFLGTITEINGTKKVYTEFLGPLLQTIGQNGVVTPKQTAANGYATNGASSTTLSIGTNGVTDAQYDFATGDLVITTSASHNLSDGDRVIIAPNALVFSCAYDGNTTQLSYPDSDADAYQTELIVRDTSVNGSNVFTVNVGKAKYPATSVHTFVPGSSDLTDSITRVLNGKPVAAAVATSAADASHGARAKTLLDGITSFLDNTLGDTASYFDTNATAPNTDWVPTALVTAYGTLQTQKAKIQALTTEFIEANHAYKQFKCERDIRYIIDGVCYDIFYKGNSQAHLAAEQYFDGGNLQIPVPTKNATVKTFQYIQQLAEDVVRNVDVLPLQTRVAQDKTLTAATSAMSDRITELFKIINNLVQHGYSSTVTFDINMSDIPKIGEAVTFHQTSLITASGQTFEWVGSGTNIQQAVPYRGGQPNQDQQVVESNEGKVYFTSTDQTGDFKIGNSLTIERATGTITGDTFDRSLFAVLTPYILSLQ